MCSASGQYAARAGSAQGDVGFFSGLSYDLFGQQLRDVLAASHVSAELAAISERPTTLAFVRLVDATRSQRGFGDYLGYAWLAAGRVEIALGLNLKIWDLAAPKIVIEEAGGRLTDLDGNDSLTSGHALATNGHLHAATLEVLAGG